MPLVLFDYCFLTDGHDEKRFTMTILTIWDKKTKALEQLQKENAARGVASERQIWRQRAPASEQPPN